MRLWDKGFKVDGEVLNFTVGNDNILDQNLLKYDIAASTAHARALEKAQILSHSELQKLETELKNISKSRNFEIKKEDEDVHTAIENHLVSKLGDLGKKIHTGRSRNDQVLVATRLYSKEKLLEVSESLLSLISTLSEFSKKHEFVPMPGYTHMQRAMPSSVGLWASSFAEAFIDDFSVLQNAYNLNNQNPLGSAAGYGTSLNIDRNYTTELLGFKKLQKNVLYVQSSRGKIESVVLSALNTIMLDINKLSSDLLLFSTKEFGFFEIPKEFTTGSSIMPQKRNPDILELARAKHSVVFACLTQLNFLCENLNSGYNRNLQLSKEPLMKGTETTLSTIRIISHLMKNLKVNEQNCTNACTPEIFATDYAFELVKKGTAFRDAYKQTASNLGKIKPQNLAENLKSKKSIGATGNLQLEEYDSEAKKLSSWLKGEREHFDSKLSALLG